MRARCHHLINSNRLTNTRLALAMHIKCRRWNMIRANRRIVWSIQFKSRCVAPRRPFAFSAFLFCLLLWIDKFDKAKGKQQNVGMSRHSCSSDERKETELQHFVCVVWTNYQKIIQIVFVVQSSPLVGHSPSAERRHTHTHTHQIRISGIKFKVAAYIRQCDKAETCATASCTGKPRCSRSIWTKINLVRFEAMWSRRIYEPWVTRMSDML